MFYSLIYTSQAVPLLGRAALLALLAQARAHNAAQHLTGVLLYSEGHILQVLEGTQVEVEALFTKIARDPRHQHVQLVGRGPVRRREFANWGMGFSQPAYPVFAQLRRLVRHPQSEGEGMNAAPSGLSLRDLLQPFVLQTIMPI